MQEEYQQGYRITHIPPNSILSKYAKVPFYYSFARDLPNYEQVEKHVNNGANMSQDTLGKYEGQAIFYKFKGTNEVYKGSVLAVKPQKGTISIMETEASFSSPELSSIEWISLSKYILNKTERKPSVTPIVPMLQHVEDNMIAHIIYFLPVEDLCFYSTVSHLWNRLCNLPSIWEACFRQQFNVPTKYTPYATGGWKGEYVEWTEVAKFAKDMYIYNTARDPRQAHITRYLLHHRKHNINEQAWRYCTTVLGCAIESGHLGMVQHLIDHGADVKLTHGREGRSNLYTAIKSKHTEIAQYLKDKHKCTIQPQELDESLKHVSGSNAVHLFKYLLEDAGGATKLAQDPKLFGEVLNIIITASSVEILEELVQVPGLSPSTQDPVIVAAVLQNWVEQFGGFTLPTITSNILRTLRALISFGFPKNVESESGETPIQLYEQKLMLLKENDGAELSPQEREQFLLAKVDPQLGQLRELLMS